MSITITLPDEVHSQLQRAAEVQRRSVEEIVADILSSAMHNDSELPTPEEVVARIRAGHPNPDALRAATTSLAEALRSAPQAPDFDLGQWERGWAAVEAEISATTRTNDVAEGRA